jgi:hypothetical protein
MRHGLLCLDAEGRSVGGAVLRINVAAERRYGDVLIVVSVASTKLKLRFKSEQEEIRERGPDCGIQ